MPPRKPPHAARLVALRRALRVYGVDAFLVTGVHNLRYLTGFTGDDSALLATRDQAFFLTDGRYTEQAEHETTGIEILERKRGLMSLAARTSARLGVRRLGIEADHLSVASHTDLGCHAPGVEITPVRSVVEGIRQVKSAREVRLTAEAVRVAEMAFARVLPALRPGRTELELARMLEDAMRDLGAEGPSFPTIVAAAERSSLPHARPTTRRIRRGDAVLFDWGALRESYTSDLTRVVFVDTISPFFERIYGIVLHAQRRAIRRVQPGLTAETIDHAARDYLKSRRHGKHFNHGLGHGLGLEIHELPVINGRSKTILKPGMIFTVEPGVYLPGRGGVRIEDDVLVTRDGHHVLTSTPKSLRDMVVRT